MQRRDSDGVETAAIASLVRLEGKHVLDVGCGKGRLLPLTRRAASLYAFDPRKESVAEARASLPAELQGRARFGVHGAEELDVARPRFDIALCGWSL